MKKENILLFLVILIATVLRFFSLSHVPPSASLDEATIGWNAYSILQTGKDEYGYHLPILLRAYDDYRPALYVYSVIPFIRAFGLNVLSVRLPSVILSVITVFSTYFLVLELFKNQKIINPKHLGILSSFLLAISPWHIYISRLGHEVNLGLSFFVLGALFFLKRRIYLSAIFIILSFVSYQSEKIFIPVMVIGITILFKNELLEMKKKILISAVLGIIILAPFVKATLSPDALLRYNATNVFDANKSRYIQQSLLLQKAVQAKDLIGQVIYNRRILSGEIISEGYLSHFNPVWLFTNPDNGKFKSPGLGLLYFWTIPFIIIGIYFLVSRKFDLKIKFLIFLWFLASPLSASITTESPHALRSLTFLPTWDIFTALGVIFVYSALKKNFRRVYLGILALLFVFSLAALSEQYFKVFPKVESGSFQYALSRAIPYVLQNDSNYKKVVFSNTGDLYQSYMFFLFYSKYDPKLYQSEGGTKSGGYNKTHRFGKYEFRPIDIGSETHGDLYVGNYDELNLNGLLAKQVKTLNIFQNLDGTNSIKVVTK